jgi:SAM-dependent methyltransferase
MIERARARLASASESSVRFHERTAAEVDRFEAGSFDAVAASLVLSEMGRAERAFVLREARARLRPGGTLAVADEVRPRRVLARGLLALARLPQAALAWLVAGSLSHPIPDLGGEIAEAGFEVLHEERWLLGSLAVVVARRPG